MRIQFACYFPNSKHHGNYTLPVFFGNSRFWRPLNSKWSLLRRCLSISVFQEQNNCKHVWVSVSWSILVFSSTAKLITPFSQFFLEYILIMTHLFSCRVYLIQNFNILYFVRKYTYININTHIFFNTRGFCK